MNSVDVLKQVLQNKAVTPFFQPIISLQDGAIFAYEALSRIHVDTCNIGIENIFKAAAEENCLWELEMLCRKKSLKKARDKPSGAKLFINFDAHTIRSPQLKAGFTHQRLEKYQLNPNEIVFEITEKSAITDISEFSAAITHYRDQNFQIAVDDFGSGYSGLNRVCAFSPDFLKLDMELIRDLDSDPIKKAAVSTTVKFCKEAGIKVIAEGIETESELHTLIAIGADYGQGYFLGRPSQNFEEINQNIRDLIICVQYELQEKALNDANAYGTIEVICEYENGIQENIPSVDLYNIMQNNEEVRQFFVVDTWLRVIGIITREKLLQTFSGQFGYNLGSRMSLHKIMSKNFLSVDYRTSIKDVAMLAMNRTSDKVYESIAITQDECFIGYVSVKNLLLATIQKEKKLLPLAECITG